MDISAVATATDDDLRTEMARLRAKIDDYYEAAGPEERRSLISPQTLAELEAYDGLDEAEHELRFAISMELHDRAGGDPLE